MDTTNKLIQSRLSSAETVDLLRIPKKKPSGESMKLLLGLIFPSIDKPVSMLSHLGETNFSHVFDGQLARSGCPPLRVALKVMKYGPDDEDENCTPDDEVKARFTEEGRIHDEIGSHPLNAGTPRITRVYEKGVIEGVLEAWERTPKREDIHYLVTEFVDGERIDKYLLDGGYGCSGREKADILIKFGEGLSIVHRTGYVYGDAKPENAVQCKLTGSVKLIDFGSAERAGKFMSGEKIVATPGYVAPERFGPHNATPLSDIFSFGVMAYEAFEGRQPFTDDCGAAPVLCGYGMDTPPAMESKDAKNLRLDGIVRRCLEMDPAKRPQSMDAVLAEMRDRIISSRVY
jgi:serine/threonine protein kinase